MTISTGHRRTTVEACERLIERYRKNSPSDAAAVLAVIHRTDDDIHVFAEMGRQELIPLAKDRLSYLRDRLAGVETMP